MFITKPKEFTLTLFVYTALVFALAASTEGHVQRRDHADLKRLVKKRSPFPQGDGRPLVPVAGAGAAPSIPSSPEPTTTDSTSTSQISSSISASVSASSTSQSTSVSSSTSISATQSSSSTESTSTSASTTAVSSTTTSLTSEHLNFTSAPPPPPAESVQVVRPTSTMTKSVDPTATNSSTPLPQSGASKAKSATLTALIVVAASIAGVTILWTIFRKWKLGRSSKFDERLQPIDWQPTNDDDGIVPPRRRASGSSYRSAPRGGYDVSDHGHNTSDHGHAAAIPDHDFTAVPSTLAPVGGYADLSRGPSPQPQMHQMHRGPSLSRPTYDVGVPLHHQAGYGTQGVYDYQAGSRRY